MNFYAFKGKIETVDNPNSKEIKAGDDYVGRFEYQRDSFVHQAGPNGDTFSGRGTFQFKAGTFDLKDIPVDITITVYGQGNRQGEVAYASGNEGMEIYLNLSVHGIPGTAISDGEAIDFSVGPGQFDFSQATGRKVPD